MTFPIGSMGKNDNVVLENYFADAVLHPQDLEKLRRLIVQTVYCSVSTLHRFHKTPVKDLLATDNRNGHHTEISDL